MGLFKVDIAIVILSCDKFSVTWRPCIDHFFEAWPDCPYPVYLLNNFKSSTDPRVKNLLIGQDDNWSDTLKKGLEKVSENRVFFIFDDTFILNFKIHEINLIFKMAVENNLDSVSLRKKTFDRPIEGNQLIYLINAKTRYRNSLFLNLIRKDVLLKLLESGETAWQFEKKGNIRSEKYSFYSVYQMDLVSYHHGILKGKWFPAIFNYLQDKGYTLGDNKFEVHSKFRVVIINLYVFFWNITQKLLHFFFLFFLRQDD